MTDISKEAVSEAVENLNDEAQSLGFGQHKYAILIEAQAARIEQLEAAIKRQAGAAKTLRELTLSEVQHLKDKDRSEYAATKTIESEREANAILTDRVEQLEADVEHLSQFLIDAKEALATARNDALKEAADVCKYNSSEWDSTAKRHNLKKWSLNIGCAHVGHAYEAAILAIMTKEPNT